MPTALRRSIEFRSPVWRANARWLRQRAMSVLTRLSRRMPTRRMRSEDLTRAGPEESLDDQQDDDGDRDKQERQDRDVRKIPLLPEVEEGHRCRFIARCEQEDGGGQLAHHRDEHEHPTRQDTRTHERKYDVAKSHKTVGSANS